MNKLNIPKYLNRIYPKTSKKLNELSEGGGGSKTTVGYTYDEVKDSFAEGKTNTASEDYSHAEGFLTVAKGPMSHSEGEHTEANGHGSHAEGSYTKAGRYAHAEGHNTEALGFYSHAEGDGNDASGQGSHAEGYNTYALGMYSHAEGCDTETTKNAFYSHVEGLGTSAKGIAQHVGGKYNKDVITALEIIGNGGSENDRSNARVLYQNGNETISGNFTAKGGTITIGSTSITEEQFIQLLALLPTTQNTNE